MKTPTTYTKTGTKSATSAKLANDVFGVTVDNHQLLKDAYVAYMANGRVNLAVTKTRGLVRGGGKKPWKQKGTGRARFGSIRVPIWRGGGITFGPTGQENYTKRISVTAKRTAIRQALSLKNDAGKVAVIEVFALKEAKTKAALDLLNKIRGEARNVLLVVEHKTPEIVRATNNIPDVSVSSANYLNVYDVMNADLIVFENKAIDVVHEWLGKAKTAKKEAAPSVKTTEGKK